eukprot:524076-Pyramimonas_sp.AAC.1
MPMRAAIAFRSLSDKPPVTFFSDFLAARATAPSPFALVSNFARKDFQPEPSAMRYSEDPAFAVLGVTNSGPIFKYAESSSIME